MAQRDVFPNVYNKPPLLPDGISPAVFWGRPYTVLQETAQDFLTILSGGMAEARPPYAFYLNAFPCRMLLYTRRGSGALCAGGRKYLLAQQTLLYHRCDAFPTWELEIMENVWEYTVFFLSASQLSAYEKLRPSEEPLLLRTDPYGRIPLCLRKLVSMTDGCPLSDKLTDNMLLHQILCELWGEVLAPAPPLKSHPAYLTEIKHSMDTFFMDDFSLHELEERYHISRYRICREFAAAFGVPPIRYLNQKRLEAAAHLLLSTDKHVHEISLDVGFETTNHFINLFKRELGVTPQAYRDANA